MDDVEKLLNLPKKEIYVRDATFSRRLLAFLADILILDLVVFSTFASLFHTEWSMLWNGDFVVTQAMYAAIMVMALLALAYFTLFEYLLGQTPGMMLLGLYGINITLWRAFVRNSFFVPLFPFPLLLLFEPIYLLVKKQRFLEMISNTRTIEQVN